MLSFLRRYRVVLLIYTLLLIAGLILLATFGKADIHIVINRHTTAFGDFIMKYITHMGDGIFAAAVIILLLFVSIRMSLGQLMAFLSSGIIAQALKNWYSAGCLAQVFFSRAFTICIWWRGLGLPGSIHFLRGIRPPPLPFSFASYSQPETVGFKRFTFAWHGWSGSRGYTCLNTSFPMCWQVHSSEYPWQCFPFTL